MQTFILSREGNFLGVYGKTHPMITSGEPQTTSAGTYPVYNTPLGKLATMICFDADFTGVGRRYGNQGAQLIATPSLFGSPIAEFAYTQTVFRAIENRAAIVMADVAYNSAILDANDRSLKLDISPAGKQTMLVADVPLGTGYTLYSRLGDWVGGLCLAGMVFFIVFMRLHSR